MTDTNPETGYCSFCGGTVKLINDGVCADCRRRETVYENVAHYLESTGVWNG